MKFIYLEYFADTQKTHIDSRMFLKAIALLGVLVLSLSCRENKHNTNVKSSAEVVFDTGFAGSRLSKVEMIAKNEYIGYVLPENEPVNTSPWYAFGLSADKVEQIKVHLNYGDYRHRYIPKLSYDRKKWTPLESSKIKIDSSAGTATLFLTVSPEKLYVSAQELESSKNTYAWVDSICRQFPQIQKKVVGKTVLGKPLYVLSAEGPGTKHSVILIARQHPPEIPGGSIGFKSFYETLFTDTPLAQDFRQLFTVHAFPLLNPDGSDEGNWRHNANGADLNRDWVEFMQPETRAVKAFVEEQKSKDQKIRFGIDFHTSHTGPYMLVLDSINEMKSTMITSQWIQKIESSSDFTVEARRRSQELPYCYNFFYNYFGAEAVTYEEGDEIKRDIIRRRAQVYAEQLMATLLEQVENGVLKP